MISIVILRSIVFPNCEDRVVVPTYPQNLTSMWRSVHFHCSRSEYITSGQVGLFAFQSTSSPFFSSSSLLFYLLPAGLLILNKPNNHNTLSLKSNTKSLSKHQNATQRKSRLSHPALLQHFGTRCPHRKW